MLVLYTKTGCPFVRRVLETANGLGLELEERNIADPTVVAELMKRGGKRQVPYLVDDARNVEMYESQDIVEYLRKHYGEQTA
jgi:glutaredoxin